MATTSFFISLRQRTFFKNHSSVTEDVEFVRHEVFKLLESGTI